MLPAEQYFKRFNKFNIRQLTETDSEKQARSDMSAAAKKANAEKPAAAAAAVADADAVTAKNVDAKDAGKSEDVTIDNGKTDASVSGAEVTTAAESTGAADDSDSSSSGDDDDDDSAAADNESADGAKPDAAPASDGQHRKTWKDGRTAGKIRKYKVAGKKNARHSGGK